MTEKEKRNKEIIKLHNDGLSSQQIADKIGLSKGGVYKVITDHIKSLPGAIAPAVTENKPEPKQTAPASNDQTKTKRILSFGELQYTGSPNEYANKQTGEIIKVKFVPAKTSGACGHFETV